MKVSAEKFPLVSVVIPVYNGEQHIAETLRSVEAQDYRPLDIVVVDDGSIDETAGIVQSFPDVRYFRQENQGNGLARNRGLKEAKGEIIAMLDADDLWEPDKLTRQVGYLLDNPQTGYAICKMEFFVDGNGKAPAWLNQDIFKEPRNCYLPSALVVRRSALEDVGSFDEDFWYGNDSDWFFRANDKNIPMAILEEVLVKKRIHNSNETGDVEGNMRDMLRLVRSSIRRKKQQEGKTG